MLNRCTPVAVSPAEPYFAICATMAMMIAHATGALAVVIAHVDRNLLSQKGKKNQAAERKQFRARLGGWEAGKYRKYRYAGAVYWNRYPADADRVIDFVERNVKTDTPVSLSFGKLPDIFE